MRFFECNITVPIRCMVTPEVLFRTTKKVGSIGRRYFISEDLQAFALISCFQVQLRCADPNSGYIRRRGSCFVWKSAPTTAYFANTIDTISAIYFISKEKFVISSLSDIAQYMKVRSTLS